MGLLLLLITFLLLLKKKGGSVPNIIGIHETLPKSISKENWRSKEEMNHPNNRIVKINKNTEDRVQALRGIFLSSVRATRYNWHEKSMGK